MGQPRPSPNRRRQPSGIWIPLGLFLLVLGLLIWQLWPESQPPPAQTVKAQPGPADRIHVSRRAPRPQAQDLTPEQEQKLIEETYSGAPTDQITPTQVPDAPPVDLPDDTQRLAEEFVPGTTEWETVPLTTGSKWHVRVLPRAYNVIAPMPIVFDLEIANAETGERVPISDPRLRLRPLDDENAEWVETVFVDDGRPHDLQAGDRLYTATFQPEGEVRKRLLGRVMAEAVVHSPEAGVRRVPSTIIYTLGPRAKLTGRWRDEIRDGHLFIEGEVSVDEPGFFSLMGQLVGPQREPIALTRALQQLDSGTHWLTLRVWGKVIHESMVDGPYRLRNVLLMRAMNERGDYDPGETVLEAHITKPYKAGQFSIHDYVPEAPARGEQVTGDHPSQRDKPPPIKTDKDRKVPKQSSPSGEAPSTPSASEPPEQP